MGNDTLTKRVEELERKVKKLDDWSHWPMKVIEGDFKEDVERIPLIVIVRDILKRLNIKPSFTKGITYTNIVNDGEVK